MSGLSTKVPIAEVYVLEFGATPNEPTYQKPFTSVVRRETSSHIALKARFSDPKLYDQYIAGTDIPCSIQIENGQTVYEAYLSFGPTGSGFMSRDSALGEYWADCLSSGVLTPAANIESGYDRIIGSQPTATFNPRLGGAFLEHRSKIYAQVIVQIDKNASAQEITALKQFQDDLLEARAGKQGYEAQVSKRNPITDAIQMLTGNNNTSTPLETYLQAGKSAILKLQTGLAVDHPECKDMEINTFVSWLQTRGVTFGLPPLDVNIVKSLAPNEPINGIDPEIKNVVKLIRFVHDNKKNIPYFFPSLNCADIVKFALTFGQVNAKKFVQSYSPSIESKFLGLLPYLASFGKFGMHLTAPTEIQRDTAAWHAVREKQIQGLQKLFSDSNVIEKKSNVLTNVLNSTTQELKPRLSNSHNPGLHLKMHMKYSSDIPKNIREKGMDVKVINDDPSKAKFDVFAPQTNDENINPNVAFAIININKKSGSIDLTFTSPVTTEQTADLLTAILKDMPNTVTAVKISAPQGQLKQEQLLENAVKSTFGHQVKVKVDIARDSAKHSRHSNKPIN